MPGEFELAEAEFRQFLPGFAQAQFHAQEARCKPPVGLAQRGFSIDIQVAGQVHHGKQQVADLLRLSPCSAVIELAVQFGQFLVDFLPALQPGSSIMPGKVNPVVPEAVCMVAAQVMGNDATIAIGGQAGNFELNVMLPVIAYNLLQSIEILAGA